MMTVSGALLTLLAVGCVGGLVATQFFLRYLRLHHRDTWEKLGSPSLVMNNSIRNGLAVTRWLWAKEFLDLEDPRLTRFAKSMLLYQILYLALFGVVVIFGASGRTQ